MAQLPFQSLVIPEKPNRQMWVKKVDILARKKIGEKLASLLQYIT
jgi:hypothetical protein